MVERCITVDIIAPANIISTNIKISPTSCIEVCEIQATVEWQNTGDIADMFTPSIKVDGSTMQHSSESLGAGQTVSHSFTVSNLMAGSHTIETYPNTVIFNVYQVDICSWILSKGGATNVAIFDIMTLVSAYLGHADVGFPVTISHIMGTVAYYLGHSGGSLTGCTFTYAE